MTKLEAYFQAMSEEFTACAEIVYQMAHIIHVLESAPHLPPACRPGFESLALIVSSRAEQQHETMRQTANLSQEMIVAFESVIKEFNDAVSQQCSAAGRQLTPFALSKNER